MTAYGVKHGSVLELKPKRINVRGKYTVVHYVDGCKESAQFNFDVWEPNDPRYGKLNDLEGEI